MRPLPLAPAAAALVALAGCAGTRPYVRGVVTSGLAYHPLPAERLADPGVRATIEACEREGRQHCREYEEPADERRSFTKGVDREAMAVLQLGRLPAGTAHEAACRLLDPTGRVAGRSREPIPVPPAPGSTLSFSCALDLGPATPEGRWTAEFDLDGARVAALPFEVLAGPRARSG